MALAVFVLLAAVALALAFWLYHTGQLAALEAKFETRIAGLEQDADNLWHEVFVGGSQNDDAVANAPVAPQQANLAPAPAPVVAQAAVANANPAATPAEDAPAQKAVEGN